MGCKKKPPCYELRQVEPIHSSILQKGNHKKNNSVPTPGIPVCQSWFVSVSLTLPFFLPQSIAVCCMIKFIAFSYADVLTIKQAKNENVNFANSQDQRQDRS